MARRERRGQAVLLLRSRAAAGYSHLAQRPADRVERAPHLRRPQASDASDPEARDDRELAGVDGVAARTQAVIEGHELETGILRHPEGDDDRRLQMLGEQGLKAERAHALDQDLTVLAVPRSPTRDPALLLVLEQRTIERGEDVRRRREPPLAVSLHTGPLIVEVERKRGGP